VVKDENRTCSQHFFASFNALLKKNKKAFRHCLSGFFTIILSFQLFSHLDMLKESRINIDVIKISIHNIKDE